MIMAKKDRRQNALKEELQERVKVERNALEIVKRLIEKVSFPEDELRCMLNQLMVSHYNDAVEERSVARLCGYPCCGNALNKSSSAKQKFHISFKTQKVYDMEELRMYCSLFCYKASNYIKCQLPAEPIWIRDTRPPDIQFLHKGEVVDRWKTVSDKEIVFEKLEELNIEYESDEETNSSRIAGVTPSTNPGVTTSKGVLPDLQHMQCVLIEWTLPLETCQELQRSEIYRGGFAEVLEDLSLTPEEISGLILRLEQSLLPLDSAQKQSQETIRRRIVKEKFHNGLQRLLCHYNVPMADVWKGFASEVSLFRFSKSNIVLKPSEWTLMTLVILRKLAESNKSLRQQLEAKQSETKEMLHEFKMSTESLQLLDKVIPTCRRFSLEKDNYFDMEALD